VASSGLVSASYGRGARAAIVFLYEATLKQRERVSDLPRMKRPQQLPVVLSREEVARILSDVYTSHGHKLRFFKSLKVQGQQRI
jgi:site-specific recombinase XerD